MDKEEFTPESEMVRMMNMLSTLQTIQNQLNKEFSLEIEVKYKKMNVERAINQIFEENEA